MNADSQLVVGGHITQTTGLIYRAAKPKPTTPTPAPAVIFVHGYRGSEDVMWIFTRTIPPDWLIFAPRAPYPDPVEGYTWHPYRGHGWPYFAQFNMSTRLLHQFITLLPQEYGADPTRIYLMGFSQGAAACLTLAYHHPGLVQGVASLVGFLPDGMPADLAPLHNLPIFMANSRQDPSIPLTRAQKDAQTLQAAGTRIAYHEYETGHRLNPQGIRDLKGWWQERGE